MANYDFDIGIIGCGSAGLSVAAGAAQLGAKVLMVEKENRLGGDCLHYGCVPSKTLIKSAHVYNLIRNSEKFGLPGLDLPRPDFAQIKARIRSVISTIEKHDSEERFCDLGAKVEFGQPSFYDSQAIRLNGNNISARNWVIATGSSPSAPPVSGLKNDDVQDEKQVEYLTNREIFSLENLPDSLIVLGGGPISVEMAQAFCRLGTKVDLIQRSAQILTKEDKDMADTLMGAMAKEGVVFHLSTTLKKVLEKNGNKQVVFKNSEGQEKTLEAKELLVALGRSPNINGLGLAGIGVEKTAKGLVLDEHLRTTNKHIYGAGDVTGKYLFTHAAGYEAGVVIFNAILKLPRKVNYDLMPWCTYSDPELAGLGHTEKTARKKGIEPIIYEEEFSLNDRSLTMGNCTGKIKMILDEKERPIGVSILGPKAGELLPEWAGVLGGKISLSRLAGTVHAYPTLAEINKNVAAKLMSEKVFSDKVRKGLKIIFRLRGRAC